MTTISISLDEKLKQEIERLSKEDGVSKSVMVRTLLKQAAFEREWARVQMLVQSKGRQLGVDTMSVDELENYLG
jgi:metal-responsive CopG/Arc/MetJ family transcriptional regulator